MSRAPDWCFSSYAPIMLKVPYVLMRPMRGTFSYILASPERLIH